MRILTVRQPWAHAIVHGAKTVENRTRNIAGQYRGLVAIHAGLTDDDGAYYDERIDRLLDLALTTADSLTRGAVVGVGALVDVHQACLVTTTTLGDTTEQVAVTCCSSPWAEPGGWHLVLDHVRPLAEPIPYRGGLGLRRLDDEFADLILDGIA